MYNYTMILIVRAVVLKKMLLKTMLRINREKIERKIHFKNVIWKRLIKIIEISNNPINCMICYFCCPIFVFKNSL